MVLVNSQEFFSCFTSQSRSWGISISFLEKSETKNHFTFHFSKRVKRKKIHFSFLEKSESNSDFTHFSREKRVKSQALWYIGVENVLPNHRLREAIFRKIVSFFLRNCFQIQLPRWVTCLLTQEKSLGNAEMCYMWRCTKTRMLFTLKKEN